jgi:carboxypeptidase family protein
MKKALFAVFAATLALTLTTVDIWAQATAQITGTVKDQTGAVLPGVEVTATQTDTGIARTAVTNETGSYVLPNLAIGPYRMEAALPGFRTYVQTGIVLQVNDNPVINPTLEVGQVSEQVQVEANATQVETRSVGVGQVVENARILDLPLNGRQVIDLVGLAGGTVPAPVNNGNSRDSFTSTQFSVAGGLNAGITYTLDGAHHQNPQDNSYLAMPFPDALQEFKLETSGSSADKGMKTAGAVSLVTKSGTNQFHGDLFEFVRNGKFNARNAFATRRDTIKRNQFGGTIGGPIKENKLFFFAGYQGTTIRQDPSDDTAFVPTAAMLAGDFTAFASAACNAGRSITLSAPFVGNRINPALFSKPALKLTSKLPVTQDPCGKVIYGSPVKTNDHQVVGKIDYQLSSNHSIFGRYLVEGKKTPASFDLNNNPLSLGTQVNALAQAFTIGDTRLYGPTMVNSFRLTANRIADGKFEPNSMKEANIGPTGLGVQAFAYSPYTSNFNVTGGFSFSSHGGGTRSAIFAASDDFSIVHGDHQMAFGGNSSLMYANSYSGQYHFPFVFNGQKTNLGMADFLMGYVSTTSNGPVAPKNKRANTVSVYASDVWKVNQRWTLSYGVRWEPYLPILDLKGGPIHYDHDAFVKGIKSTVFDTTPPGVFFPGDPGFHGKEGQDIKWTNFSPRLGFAWDVNGDGRTSIRASAGRFYDFPHTQYQNLATAAPYFPRFAVNDVDLEFPWRNYPGGDPFPLPYGSAVGRNAPWVPFSLVNVISYDSPNMQATQWNLTIQKQVADWVVSAGYLGTHTIHIWSTKQSNPSVFLGTGPCTLNGVQYSTCSTTANADQRRVLMLENPAKGQFYGYMPTIDTGGTASYNGMILSASRRAARGVTLNANYTWSHCITDPSGETVAIGTSSNTGWIDRSLERGNCATASSDRRHILNVSGVASTPQFSNTTLRAVASNWRFSPIVKVMTGSYLNITTSTDRALNGTPGQKVNQILEDPYGDKTVGFYLNAKAFAQPATGTVGTIGRNSIVGPGLWQFDLALSRTFQLREQQKLEFRADAFNVTNSFHPGNPTVNLNSGNFGQITSTATGGDPRIMQFALKYIF